MILVFLAALAHADCTTPYTREQYMSDIAMGTATIKDMKGRAFQAASSSLEKGILCVDQSIPAAAYATAYRYIGVTHWVGGDEEGSRRWFRTALELDPTYEWDLNEVPADHPMRAAFEDARFVASALPEKTAGALFLVPPAGSSFLLDGRPWTEAGATLDRPHVFQEIDGDGHVVWSALIESNELPPQYLMTEKQRAAELAAQQREQKKSGTAPIETQTDTYAVTAIHRERPKAKTPLLVGGALGVVGGGLLYYRSSQLHGEFEDASTTEDVTHYQKATNTMVLLSGGAAVVGFGLGYYGIILGAGPTVGWAWRF